MTTRFRGIGLALACAGLVAACDATPTDIVQTEGLAAAVTPASTTPFAGFMHPCGGTGSDIWVTPGGVEHFVGATAHNQWVTGNQLVDGFEDNVERGGMANPNGTLNVQYQATITPDAGNGTWETSTYVLVWPAAGLPEANGVAHGTGDLAGMTMRFTIRPDFVTPVPPTACDPTFPFSFVLQGFVQASAMR